MNFRRSILLPSLSALALVTACAYNPPRNETVAVAPGQMPQHSVRHGTVSNIDTIGVASRETGGGAVLGAVIGGVIGHQIGRGSGRDAATGVGVISGAVIGSGVERRNRRDSEIYRVGVRYDNGTVGQFDYQEIADLRVGDRVVVQDGLLYLD